MSRLRSSYFPLTFTLATALLVFLSAKFTWPDGDDGRYAVWALAIAQGEGITNIHLPEPTPEVIVPPGLSIALAPVVALFAEQPLKPMMTFSALALIALAWIYARWTIDGYGIRDTGCGMRGSGLGETNPTTINPIASTTSRTSHLVSRISYLVSRISHPASRTSHLASRIPHPATVYSLWSTVFLALWPVFIISTAWRVHTEMLYMLFTFSALAFWPKENDRAWKVIVPGLLAGAAFATRTVGLAFLPAGLLALLVRRQGSKALLFAVAFVAINAPLLIRAYHATGSPLPYTQYAGGNEAGLIDKVHSLFIFGTHYLFYGLPDLMFYRLFSGDGLLAQTGLSFAITPLAGLIGLLIAIGLLVRIFKFEVADLYFGAYLVIISSFNQADYAARGEFLFQDRYVIPVIPLAAIYLTRALMLLGTLRWKSLAITARLALPLLALYVATTALGAGISRFRAESHFRGTAPIDPARYADSPNENDRAWGSYFAAALWLRDVAPPDAVIFCRKPQEMYLASGHKADRYIEHGTGTNLLNAIARYRENGAYLIEDAFIPETAFGRERIAIIEPLLRDYVAMFELVHETQTPATRIWKVK